MHISRLFRPERLEQMIEEGFVTKTKHHNLDLWILNYSASCQYSRVWNDVTLNCRGLIIDSDDNVVARPFPKFFNLEEHASTEPFLAHEFVAFEKLDGSLGILFPLGNGDYSIATRGSFTSDQALEGKVMLKEVMAQTGFVPMEGFTYLFEILYPENRIVVDYGARRELVFLCAIHNESGANVFEFGDQHDWPGSHAKRFPVNCTAHELKTTQVMDNAEGYVLYFPSANFRVKTKFEEYVRLHRIVTGVSSKTIWKMLSSGESLDTILDHVPDEFYDWVKTTEKELTCKYVEIRDWAERSYTSLLDKYFDGSREVALQNRKLFAEHALKRKKNQLLFALLDRKPINDMVWQMVKPQFERPFAVSDEE